MRYIIFFLSFIVFLPAAGAQQLPASAQFETRLSALEREIRGLNGKIEELEHENSQLKGQVEQLKKDLEFRLNELEQAEESLGGSKAPEAAGTPSTTPTGTPTGDGTRTLGTVQGEQTFESPKTPKAEYEDAFALLRQNKYEESINAFNAFLEKYPQHELSSNVYYWLGEAYYVQNQFEKASVQFARGYQSFPKGNKATDCLLKLALSLERMNKKPEACTTLQKLGREFPTLKGTVRKKADELKASLKCS